MSALDRIVDLLPPPYAVADDALLTRVLNVLALELDAAQEDMDRVRTSHWIRTAWRLIDVEKLGALFRVARLAWEGRDLYRERLLALVVAGRQGAVGPGEIREFVHTYLTKAEQALDSVFVPGLQTLGVAEAFEPPPGRERFVPLRLVENPLVPKTSEELAARHGRVAHLFRWRDTNRGLEETWPSISIAGIGGGVTAAPVLVNLTTGDLIGYAGRLRLGQRLSISVAPDDAPRAVAVIDGVDVSSDLLSLSDFRLGQVFQRDDLDQPARLPRFARGPNDWAFFLLGLYDRPGLDTFGFGVPDDRIEEGAFDQSRFDEAVYPAGTKAQVDIRWQETEPASFRVQIPRRIVSEPAGGQEGDRPAWAEVESALRDAIGGLHAAGVKAAVAFAPFAERQMQRDRGRWLGVRLDPERGPAGRADTVTLGGRFGDPVLGGTRFE